MVSCNKNYAIALHYQVSVAIIISIGQCFLITRRINGDPVVSSLTPTPPPQSYCQGQITSGTSGNVVIQSTYQSSVFVDSTRVEFHTGDFMHVLYVCACMKNMSALFACWDVCVDMSQNYIFTLSSYNLILYLVNPIFNFTATSPTSMSVLLQWSRPAPILTAPSLMLIGYEIE